MIASIFASREVDMESMVPIKEESESESSPPQVLVPIKEEPREASEPHQQNDAAAPAGSFRFYTFY